MTKRIVIEGCAIATVDAAGTEHREGHIVIEDDRIVAVGEGAAPDEAGGAGGAECRRIDARGHLATPGLVNCHHHLYQWATRGLAQQATLFEWLVELYPVWALIDDETCWAASARRPGGAGALRAARRRPTTTTCSRATPVTSSRSRSAPPRPSACAFTRAAARWISGARRAGCRPTRSSRTATPFSPRASPRSAVSTIRRRVRWCGSRSRRARRSR